MNTGISKSPDIRHPVRNHRDRDQEPTQFMDGRQTAINNRIRAHTLKSDRPSKRASRKSMDDVCEAEFCPKQFLVSPLLPELVVNGRRSLQSTARPPR
jgi:hypothetical protein